MKMFNNETKFFEPYHKGQSCIIISNIKCEEGFCNRCGIFENKNNKEYLDKIVKS